jgi:fermentation-respiration switch protein FrsA (DUF1100 family)
MDVKKAMKFLLIFISLALIIDFVLGIYFYNISVARNNKDFLAKDTALKKSAAVSADVVFSSEAADLSNDMDWFGRQVLEEVNLISFDGLKLTGYFLKASSPSTKTAILAHGYSSQGMYMGLYAKLYYDLGYNVLMPDDRGHGKSEGNYIGFGWVDRKDYLDWIDFIIDKVGPESQIVLHGVSMGGATVLMTSGENLPVNVKAIVSDCAYTSVKEELKYQLKRMYNLPSFPLLDTVSLLSGIKAGYYLNEASALKQVKKSNTPTLFIHGDSDEFVPSYMVNDLYNACSSEKDIFIVQGANHGTAYNTDPEGYRKKVIDFIKKFVKK